MLVRAARFKDLNFFIKLIEHEQWDTTLNELIDLYSFAPYGFFIASLDNRDIGIISAVNYRSFGYIGNLIISKEFRNRGYGIRLMKYAINYLENQQLNSILLDAEPSAVPIYEKLSFIPICKSLRIKLYLKNGKNSQNIRLMQASDLSRVYELDWQFFKGNRKNYIKMRFERHPELARVFLAQDQISGYQLIFPRKDIYCMGPCVIDPKYSSLTSLFSYPKIFSQSKQIQLGVLETNEKMSELLNHIKSEQYSYSVRMIFGNSINHSQGIHAIAGADRG